MLSLCVQIKAATFTVGVPALVLPIELLYFQAIINKPHIKLTWQTATELKADYFDIERSMDCKNFEKIGNVKAEGTAASYQFDDSTLPLEADKPAYYRLKMVDTDGTFKYSKVVSLSRKKGLNVYVFPNPISHQFLVDINEESNNQQIEVFDLLGRTIYSENTEGANLLTINTLDWRSDIYILKISDGQMIFQQKIMKR